MLKPSSPGASYWCRRGIRSCCGLNPSLQRFLEDICGCLEGEGLAGSGVQLGGGRAEQNRRRIARDERGGRNLTVGVGPEGLPGGALA